jgi:hypothetical protein
MMSRLPRRGAARDDRDTLWRAAFPLFIFLGEARRAEVVVDRALMLNPSAANAWMARAMIHALRKQSEASIKAFDGRCA